MGVQDDECSENTPLRYSGGGLATISVGQTAVLVVALFVKGGLLGAYIPFSSLWLSLKGYRARDLGLVSLVDAICSFLLPVIGGAVDKFRAHNACFVVILAILCMLKLAYLPLAHSFMAILMLTAATAPLLRASNSMLDALALYAFPNKAHFSRARLAGDLGFGSVALGVGLAMDSSGTEDAIFYIFAAMCGGLSCMWCGASPYMSSIRPDAGEMSCGEFQEHLSRIARNFGSWATFRALFSLYLVGCGLGLIGTFEFVLLKEMMGSGALLGMCKAVGTLGAIPVWTFAIQLMDRIGLKNVQLLALAAIAARMFILGVITKPWQALLSELLAGVGGFALAYSTITVFTGRVMAEDMKGTVQTLIFVIFIGAGAGGAPLLGSFIVEWWGIQNMFRWAGVLLAAICLVVLAYDVLDGFVWGTYRSLEDECGAPPASPVATWATPQWHGSTSLKYTGKEGAPRENA